MRAARAVGAVASAIVLVCALASSVSIWFVVAGTLACAITAGAAFYGAYEGFDERLRRGP